MDEAIDPQVPKCSPPLRREISKPYYLLRTPDRLGHYLKRENYRALFSPRDPITRFLARATLDADGRPQAIRYDFGGISSDELTPMEFLSSTELDAFEQAARAFYEKAMPSVTNVTPYEKDLRKGFRLPDPELEPDAYWVYGPPYDRKLLIIWGCELEQDSSLKLVETKVSKGETNIVNKLSAFKMPWSAMHRQALDMIVSSKEPLAQYIAKPLKDAKGNLKSVVVGGRTIPAEALRRPRFLPRKQIEAIEAAAIEFYERAHSEHTDVSPFEKELRRNFRLPNPDKLPLAYMVSQSPLSKGMIILINGEEKFEDTLSLVEDSELGIPPPSVDADGNPKASETICDKLKERVTPWKTILSISGVAAACVAITLAVFGVFADRTPPEVAGISAVNDPEKIAILFSEPVSEKSLLSDEQHQLRREGIENPAVKPKRHFTVIRANGERIEILSLYVDKENPFRVIAEVPPMKEEEDYSIYIENVRDASSRQNSMAEPYERSFSFRDDLPPELLSVSADGSDPTKLTLLFSEPLFEPYATRERNYLIDGFAILEAELDSSQKQITLKANAPFASGERYRIEVDGVADDSQGRNPIARGTTKEFAYIDSLPPRIVKVVAEGLQSEVLVSFNEPLAPGIAQTPSNYIIKQADGRSFTATVVKLTSDGRTAILRTPSLQNAIRYTLQVINLQDRATEPNVIEGEAAKKEFIYAGKPDLEPPFIADIRANIRGNVITVRFSEPIDGATGSKATNYQLGTLESRVVEARPKTGEGESLELVLNNPLTRDKSYQLTINGITDLVGNQAKELVSKEFRLPGLSIGEIDVLGIEYTELKGVGDQLSIVFTSPVTVQTGGNADFYRLDGDAVVETVLLEETNSRKVILQLDRPLKAQLYTLTVTNIALAEDPRKVQKTIIYSIKGPGFKY